jgi:hypothetical protein
VKTVRVRVVYDLDVHLSESFEEVLRALQAAGAVLHREVAATNDVRLVRATMRFKKKKG